MKSLEDRIQQLSPSQRQVLVARIAARRSHEHRRTTESGAGASTGASRLAVFVEGAEQDGLPAILREHLKSRLPAYMVPTAVNVLQTFPRTASGKADRKSLESLPTNSPSSGREGRTANRTASKNENCSTDRVADGQTTTDNSAAAGEAAKTEATLAKIWADVLGLDEVGLDEDFFELGGDSILSIRIIARANQAGIKITPKQFFDAPTVGDLAAIAETESFATSETAVPNSAKMPLLPIQHWFFDQTDADPHHWNQAVVLEVFPRVSASTIETALRDLWEYHDGLRLTFLSTAEGWSPRIAPSDAPPTLQVHDVQEENFDDEVRRVEDQEHAKLDLEEGPLMKALLFRSPSDGKRLQLVLILHHLIVDGISWHILLDDLETLCGQIERDESAQLPVASTSLATWAAEVRQFADSDKILEASGYWGEVPDSFRLLPTDSERSRSRNVRGLAATWTSELSTQRTETLLRDVPEAYRTQINDILLTALLLATTRWTGQSALHIDLEGHGREVDRIGELGRTLDLSRTVGWLTSVFPITLELEESDEIGATLKSIKEQLRAIPHHGLEHGILRYVRADPAVRNRLQAQSRPEILFNYLGQTQAKAPNALFQHVRTGRPSARSPRPLRPYLLEVDAVVQDGALKTFWTYSPEIHREETIQKVAEDFLQQIEDLIDHCVSGSGGVTPSDFPLANLDQGSLDRLDDLLGED